MTKRTYLCTTDYDEKYFDFHCLPGGKRPSDGMGFYTICGVALPNRAEYLMIVGGITWVAFLVFFNLHFRSGTEVVYGGKSTANNKTGQQSKAKKNK